MNIVLEKKINKYLETFLFVFLFFFLELEYIRFIYPLFQDMGFTFEFSAWKYFVGKIILLFVLWLNYELRGFNYFVNSLFLVLMTFPNIIIFEFMASTPIAIVLFSVLFHFLFYLLSIIKIKPVLTRIKIVDNRFFLLMFLGIVLLMLLPFFLVYGLHININSFLFRDIYEIRRIALEKSTTITSYFYPWLVKIIIPIGIIISLKNKRYAYALMFLLAQLYLFSISPQKSVFISLFVILIMFIKDYESQLRAVLLSIVFVFVLSIVISVFSGNIMLESIFVRRVFFLPSVIINDYFDFFRDQKLFWSYGFLKDYFHYPFAVDPPHLIGTVYFNHPQENVNSGFISDGFMNMGYVGVLINMMGVLIVFKILDILRIPSDFAGIILIVVFTFISSYFFTSLLTHGVVILLIFVFLLKRKEIKVY